MTIIYFVFAFIFIIIWAVNKFLAISKYDNIGNDQYEIVDLNPQESVNDAWNNEVIMATEAFDRRVAGAANMSIAEQKNNDAVEGFSTDNDNQMQSALELRNLRRAKFSLKKAVVYSTLMNPKFKEF